MCLSSLAASGIFFGCWFSSFSMMCLMGFNFYLSPLGFVAFLEFVAKCFSYFLENYRPLTLQILLLSHTLSSPSGKATFVCQIFSSCPLCLIYSFMYFHPLKSPSILWSGNITCLILSLALSNLLLKFSIGYFSYFIFHF